VHTCSNPVPFNYEELSALKGLDMRYSYMYCALCLYSREHFCAVADGGRDHGLNVVDQPDFVGSEVSNCNFRLTLVNQPELVYKGLDWRVPVVSEIWQAKGLFNGKMSF